MVLEQKYEDSFVINNCPGGWRDGSSGKRGGLIYCSYREHEFVSQGLHWEAHDSVWAPAPT